MSRNASPDAVQLAACRLDRRLVACAQAVEQRPTRRVLTNPWVFAAGAAAVLLLLPRRFRMPIFKAALPVALGLLKHR
jgi:hypothetical protein